MTGRCFADGCQAEPIVTMTVRFYPADSWLWWLVARLAYTRRRACREHVTALVDELKGDTR